MTQYFKGDSGEIKMFAVAEPMFSVIDAALDDFYLNGFESDAFLLMLFDEKRMPFSERVNRASFVSFIKEALKNFPVTGTFESYIFILKSIFGSEADILFDVTSPGELSIDIFSVTTIVSDFVAQEFNGSSFDAYEIVDNLGNVLSFRSLPGIANEYELSLLFSEIMPAGISPTYSLGFYSKYDFVGYDALTSYDMIDNLGNQIIFTELGG